MMAASFYARRRFLQLAAAATAGAGSLAMPTLAAAAGRDEVIEAAKRESGLVWYDHYDRTASEAILGAFQRAYPFVKKVEVVDVPSAQKTAKIIQESMAGGPTTDVLLNDAAVQQSLYSRGLLLESDWAALGVATSPIMTPTPYMVLATTAIDLLLYNTTLVKEQDVPHSWEESVDPKWHGRIGQWMRAATFVHLIPGMGEAKVRDLVDRLAALRPRMFNGLFPLAQAVGSGEIAFAITSYDTAVLVADKGAPVKTVELDPTPLSLICGSVPKYGRNPNTARLFLSWLASAEGAITFENQTKRGNYFVKGTQASKLLKGRKLSYYTSEQSIAQAKTLNALETEFARKIASR
jgi:iron(III) transport system substrate-binding protein